MIELETGEKEILVTSLTDTEKYNYGLFQSLYHQRWGIEESYKKLKFRCELENFSGKSILSIRQDFYAKILIMNLTALFIISSLEEVEQKTKDSKHKYKINWAQAIGKMKNNFLYLFIKRSVGDYIKRIQEMIIENLCPIRPGRTNPINHKPRRKYYVSYKSNI